MHWTEPATSEDSQAELEKKLWDAANQLWAGADLKPSEYSPTVLGLIFLRYADVKFAGVEAGLKPQAGTRRKIGPADYHAAGVIFLPDEARFAHLLSLIDSKMTGYIPFLAQSLLVQTDSLHILGAETESGAP